MTLFHPDAAPKGRPYWWEDITEPDLSAPPPPTTELLIVGAGYTGLSAAIAAHDAGAKVAVIDGGQPGHGASTRNGGMVGAHPRLSFEALAGQFGKDTAAAIFAEAGPALEFVKALIENENIDCDFALTGRIQLAYTRDHLAGQEKLARRLGDSGATRAEMVSRDALPQEIATPLYHGGLLFPEHGGLHPAKYHRGLLAAVLNRGIPVSAHQPARAIEGRPGAYDVRTPTQRITADKVLLATNGYTRAPFSWLARRVFPLPSYLIATEPLSPNLIGELAPGRRMMVETRARHSYFRVSPDGSRIIFGGRAAIQQVAPAVAAKRLFQTLTQIWPQLRQARLTHVWSGNTGYSFGHMPQVGQTPDGIHFAMGYSGSGTVMAPYLGAKAAWQAVGDPRGETAYSETGLASRWFFRGGAPWFLGLADPWYRHVVDRLETRKARH